MKLHRLTLHESRICPIDFKVKGQGHGALMIENGFQIRPKEKICEFTVTRPTLIFGPDPKGFYRTFKRQIFQISHFPFQTIYTTKRIG